jgi:glyoxylase-like metal-dependent hydrolase (beta-lactamase superfamily II)
VLIKDQVSLLIDPSIDLQETDRDVLIGKVDIVINSHAHEDHFAGNHLFPEAQFLVHEKDVEPMQSLDTLLDIYEVKESERTQMAKFLTDIFHYKPVDDIQPITDGEVIDLGRNKVHCIHAPGHTPGHVMLLFEPHDVLFVADLDLTSFGPYYGDKHSSLEDTIQSLKKMRAMAKDLRACISFHQAGVVDTDIEGAVDRYCDIIWDRETRLLEFIQEPKSLDQIIDKCIVYRRKVPGLSWQYTVEKNTMSRHIDRLVAQDRAAVEPDGRIRAR